MKILMTGSTGFTGKCLVRMLEDSNHEIWHLVRNKKGFEREFVWDFMSPLPQGLPPYDILVHLAAHVNFDKNLEITQYNVNTISTIQLSANAKAQNAYFIFASMVGIHGSQYTVIDQDTPINPENHYAVSKYLAEEVIKSFVDNYSILRICGIYGLNGPQHLGINKAISDSIYKKIRPILKGSGKAKRNYICVNDVARWVLCLIDGYDTAKTDRKEILYLAGAEVMTIEEYLQSIIEILLPGMELERIAGPESKDLIVRSSPASFPQLIFRQYLNSLIHQ
jgi:nucleoside-diphosphate-sugar epimerase